jgi:hypothetical protein
MLQTKRCNKNPNTNFFPGICLRLSFFDDPEKINDIIFQRNKLAKNRVIGNRLKFVFKKKIRYFG